MTFTVKISEKDIATNIAISRSEQTTTPAEKSKALLEAYRDFRMAPDFIIEASDDVFLHTIVNAPFDHFCEISRAYFSDDEVISYLWENDQHSLINLCTFYLGVSIDKIRIEKDVMWLGDEMYIQRLETSYLLNLEPGCPWVPVESNPQSKCFALLIERASIAPL